jgi:hypothetical protein
MKRSQAGRVNGGIGAGRDDPDTERGRRVSPAPPFPAAEGRGFGQPQPTVTSAAFGVDSLSPMET